MNLLAHTDDGHIPRFMGPLHHGPVAAIAAIAVLYTVLAVRQRQEPRGWSLWRTASFLLGATLLIVALNPALSPYPAGDFRGHMHQHLLLGMYAPLALVLGAPMTLLLRTIPRNYGQRIGGILRSRPARVPPTP